MPTKNELKMFQAYPLEMKIAKTKLRIREWVDYYGTNGVYVSFSGGKDSTVLLNIVRQMYPDIEAVFVNTGLEYPEIQSFVKTFDNVTTLRPKMRFDEVIRKYGYPFIGKEVARAIHDGRLLDGKWGQVCRKKLEGTLIQKSGKQSLFNCKKYAPLLEVDFLIGNKCCEIMKKTPIHAYERKSDKVPITAQLAEESRLRTQQWLKNGCNAFEASHKVSNPMSFWTEQDILQYILLGKAKYGKALEKAIESGAWYEEEITKFVKDMGVSKLEIASVYGDIVFGDKSEQYDTLLCDCGGKLCTTGCDRTGCIFCGFGAHLEKGESRFERLKKTHPRQYEYCMGGGAYDTDGLWKPTKDGLGMAHCIDEINKIYGKDFIRY